MLWRQILLEFKPKLTLTNLRTIFTVTNVNK